MKATINTSEGEFTVVFSSAGLMSLVFPLGVNEIFIPEDLEEPTEEQFQNYLSLTKAALNSMIDGEPPEQLPPLDLSLGTEFQQLVWNTLLEIPWGETWTYAQLGREVDRPTGARAVGTACGANPVPVLVPCHRVLSSSGGLCGFTAGLPWKQRLLEIEGAWLPLKVAVGD